MITIFKKFSLSFIILSILFLTYKFFFYDKLDNRDYFEILSMSLFMSLIMLIVHIVILKRRGFKVNDRPYLKLKIKLKKNRIVEKIHQNFYNWKLDSTFDDKLIFKVKPNFITSFGEKVYIEFKNDNEAIIRSESLIPTTLFDYGNNLKNIRELNNLLS